MGYPALEMNQQGFAIPILIIAALLIGFLLGNQLLNVLARPKVLGASYPDALHMRVRSELKTFTDWLSANNAKGYIGEVGWPNNVSSDQVKWNGLADAWFQDADGTNLWVSVWSTGEWWGSSYPLNPYSNSSPNSQASVIEAHPSNGNYLRGVNDSGGEFGTDSNFSNTNPGSNNTKYHFDNQGTFNYLQSRGLKLVRIPFRWERLQNSLNGNLNPGELQKLKDVVTRAENSGFKIVLDMHNYGEYMTGSPPSRQIIGGSSVNYSQFADVWQKISSQFKNDPNVYYGLMNEPHDYLSIDGLSGAKVWEKASQQALDAIRGNGDNKLIMVPGYNWAGVQNWASTHPSSWINDPASNFRYEAHHYWDRDNSGKYANKYDSEVVNAESRGFKASTVALTQPQTSSPTPTPSSSPSPTPSTAPTQSSSNGLNASYFNNTSFSGSALTRVDPNIDFNWKSGSPMSGINKDGFSVRWTGQVQPQFSETYTFYVRTDDGARVWVNGQLVIDNWRDQSATEKSGTITLSAGQLYDLKVEFYDNMVDAVAQLSWSSPSQSKQIIPQNKLFTKVSLADSSFKTEFFNNKQLSGTPVVTRNDTAINFNWGVGSPVSGVNKDGFSVRFSKNENFAGGNVTFTASSDDGMRIYLDNNLIYDKWFDQGASSKSVTTNISAGIHPLRIEYYESGGIAEAHVSWK